MRSVITGKYLSAVILILSALAGIAKTAEAADANLRMVFTTTNAGGSYGNSHVHVVWIKDSAGNFVYTAGSTTTDNKRALWANSRAYALSEWYNSNPSANRSADIAARTGATQTTYRTYDLNWNWKKKDGTTLPDGNYQIHFLCTNSDSGTPRNKASFTITKGTSAWTIGPVSQGGYNNVTLTYTPAGLGIVANSATNVAGTSAALNGEVTGTDGVNPTVYIYWGTADGGTTSSNWDHEINLGSRDMGAFSTNVTELDTLTTYYYRCRAVTTNPAKDIWSSPAVSFTTLTPDVAEIELPPAALDFEAVNLNDSKDLLLTVRNTGRLALSINSLTLVGLDNEVYSLIAAPALPLVLPALTGSVDLTVRFAPQSVQDYQYAKLAIGSNAPEKVTYVELAGAGGPAAALGTRPVGGIGGYGKAAAMYGDKILLGQGAMLVLLDVSNPALPAAVSQLRLEGPIEAITVQGDTAYAALGNKGFAAVNLKDFTPLSGAATFETGGFASDIDADGTLLCVADGIAGTHAYNISAPLAPVYVKTYETSGASLAVDNLNGSVYVLDESKGLQVFKGTSAIPAGNIVGHWKLDDRSGTVAMDTSGNDHAGTLVNMDNSSWVTGKTGGALGFDGVNDYVSIAGYKGITGTGSRTCMAWVKTTGTDGNMVIIDWGANVSGQQWLFGIFSTGKPAIYAGGPYIQTNATITDGQWHHVSAVLENDGSPIINEIKLYIDGILQAVTSNSGTAAINTISGPDVTFGAYEYNAQMAAFFPGLLDDVRIYDYALTAEEIESLQPAGGSPAIEFGAEIVASPAAVYTVDTFGSLAIFDAAGQTSLSEKSLQVGSAADIRIQGQYAYVAGENGLEVLNVSNPASPASVAVYPAMAKLKDLVLNNTVAYAADGAGGLAVFDISNPGAVSLLGTYSLFSAASGVSSPASSENVYVVGGEQNLVNYDLSSPGKPAVNELYDILEQAEDIAVQGQYAFVAAGLSGLKIYNLSNPAAPAASLQTDGFASAVSVNGTKVMISDGTTVYIVNITNPMSPSLIGSWTADAWALDVAAGTTYGYVANGGMGIVVLAMSNAQPVAVYPIAGVAYGLALDTDILYAACGTEGLYVLDVLNPAAPSLAAQYDMPGVLADVTKVDHRLCVADALNGISVVDVTDPAAPVLYAGAETTAPAFHISSSGSRLFVADKKGGLAVLGVTSWPKTSIGEMTGDNQVNITDLILLADQWLGSESNLDILNANLNYYDTTVNTADLAVLTRAWLADYTPPVVNLEISGINPSDYVVSYHNLGVGKTVYVDRGYTYSNVPSAYQDKTFIQTKNDDKQSTGNSFLTFAMNRDCTVYVAHDNMVEPKPSWLSSFTDSGDNLVTSDSNKVLRLYRKDFSAGTVTLGGNRVNESTAISMYTVVIIEK